MTPNNLELLKTETPAGSKGLLVFCYAVLSRGLLLSPP
jgi:hypothetical protein